jgi:hypothetical protein
MGWQRIATLMILGRWKPKKTRRQLNGSELVAKVAIGLKFVDAEEKKEIGCLTNRLI